MPLAVAVSAVLAPPAGATGITAVYDSTPLGPGTTNGNIPSVGFEATGASEFGNQITLASAGTPLVNAVVTMSSWACENQTAPGWQTHTFPGACDTPTFTSGTAYNAGGACEYTVPYCAGDTFSEPITFNIYKVGPSSSVGSLILTDTQNFNIPYRPPSDNVHCTGTSQGDWYDPTSASCFSGMANNITFTLPSVILPKNVIWSIAFNTTTYGYAPIGAKPCDSTLQGCPYDALNIGVNDISAPSLGSDPLPGTVYWNTAVVSNYCTAATSAFQLDTYGPNPDSCWSDESNPNPPYNPYFVPAVQFNAILGGSTAAFYVAPAGDGGVDVGTCTLASQPCATIGYALQQEALNAPYSTGSVINLAKGTYGGADTIFAGLAPANSGVTITGSTKKGAKNASVIEPTSCASLSTATAGAGFVGAQSMVTLNTGDNGITLQNVTLDGAGISSCPGYIAGAYITGGTTGDALVGDTIESGATYGILTDAGADSTIISNNLSPVLCATTVKGPNTGLNAGWTSPADLLVKSIPACSQFVESGHGLFTGVFINGVDYCAAPSATKREVVLTGLSTPTGCVPITNSGGRNIATGAQVIFNTSVAPFTQFGIACNSPVGPPNPATDCAISDNTVTAGGTILSDFPGPGGAPPIGIVVTSGATANVDGNSVSGVADSIANDPHPGQTTNDGTGIALIPGPTGLGAGNTTVGVNDLNNPNTGHGNKLSGNDIGILVVAGNNSPAAAYEVNSNTVSSANKAGMVIQGLGHVLGAATANLASPLESNSVSGAATGAGIELLGDVGQTIGGPLATEGNTSSGNGLGIALGPCTSALCQATGVGGFGQGTQNNLVQNNTAGTNILAGVLSIGAYQPNEEVEQVPAAAIPLDTSGNTFNTNTWTGNGTLPTEADGVNVMDGTGWGGGCASQAGSCDDGPTLDYVGANQTLNSTNPGSGTLTLAVCDPTATSEPLPIGSEITLNDAVTQAADGGTFFVTAAAIVPAGTVATCTSATPPSTNITVSAVAPALVGTADAAQPFPTAPTLITGQPYILGTGNVVAVNANGAAAAALNSYGSGANSNSCTPIGVNAIANVFGSSTGNSVLNSSTGGVNATYINC